MNEDPPGMQVKADSPYKTVKELADAIKAAPAGKFKASGTGQGGIWHLALVGWLRRWAWRRTTCLGAVERRRARDAGSRGRRPRHHHLLGARSPRDDRRRQGAQPRRSWRRARNPAFPDMPTLKEAMGIDYATGAWRGIAAPKGLPRRIASKLTAALKKVYDFKEFKEFMSNRGFGMVWGDAAQFASSWTRATPRWARP